MQQTEAVKEIRHWVRFNTADGLSCEIPWTESEPERELRRVLPLTSPFVQSAVPVHNQAEQHRKYRRVYSEQDPVKGKIWVFAESVGAI